MANDIQLVVSDSGLSSMEKECLSLLESKTGVKFTTVHGQLDSPKSTNIIAFLQYVVTLLREHGLNDVAGAYSEVIQRCTTERDFGGYGFHDSDTLSEYDEKEIVFLCSAYLEALKSAARARSKPRVQQFRPPGRRGMTMAEKIFAMHDVSNRGFVKAGDIIQVDVDWILASELSWKGMEGVYNTIGRPGIFRNDRFWLAGDHRVEPPLYNVPHVRALMDASKRAEKEFKMTEFQGFNYTILHTEFARERAQPGMLVIGADSHTCSAGSVSCLAIGLGATDVIMPLVTGQTWFTVPETVHLRLINKPPFGIGGKDIILYILKEFKRNTIAADRIVEFSGPGLASLSCDSRFAIANMCTEFGAITGIFAADERTVAFLERRRVKKHKSSPIYFQPDVDATYAESFEIDLSKAQSWVALYPSPDNVVPVSEVAGMVLDGCFIGACTTAEEDLILGALVLSAGLQQGQTPVNRGRRVVVPGSRPIQHKLEELGLLEFYRRAGFKIGVPGCSMCIGQGVDQAAPGEKWLSSQNRNFKNRMGPGSIGNLASAATVAASSFTMKICDPQELLDMIDRALLEQYLEYQPFDTVPLVNRPEVHYSEPHGANSPPDLERAIDNTSENTRIEPGKSSTDDSSHNITNGRILRLGDFIDTDAIIPSKFLSTCTTNEELGSHCMEFFMPEFRQLVQSGLNIIVAGRAFGCGSSRDVAVNALLGAGVKCVIAESFSFIYGRNQPNIGLLGVSIKDDAFFTAATQGRDISIDLTNNTVTCGEETWSFQLSEMEKQLINMGGLTEAFQKHGKDLFNVMHARSVKGSVPSSATVGDIESLLLP